MSTNNQAGAASLSIAADGALLTCLHPAAVVVLRCVTDALARSVSSSKSVVNSKIRAVLVDAMTHAADVLEQHDWDTRDGAQEVLLTTIRGKLTEQVAPPPVGLDAPRPVRAILSGLVAEHGRLVGMNHPLINSDTIKYEVTLENITGRGEAAIDFVRVSLKRSQMHGHVQHYSRNR